MGRRFRVIASLALLLAASTDAFSTNKMELHRIQRQKQTQLAAHHHPHQHQTGAVAADAMVKMTVAGIMTAALLLFSSPLPSLADGSRVVGELRGSGLVFKVSFIVDILCFIGS